jgi:hypothetical protein
VNDIIYENGSIVTSFNTMKEIVKLSGLKSKKVRKIKKRFKKLLTIALKELIKENQ